MNLFKYSFEDDILCDFGEIKIPFDSKFYSVFVGTGYNYLFPFYQSIETIAKSLGIKREIVEVLEYVNDIAYDFGSISRYDSKLKYNRKISIPSEEYFLLCKEKYNFRKLNEESFLSFFFGFAFF